MQPPLPTSLFIVGEPAVIGFPANGFKVYVRDNLNGLWVRTFNGSTFDSWTNVTSSFGNAISSPEGCDLMFDETGGPIPTQEEGFNVFIKGPQSQMRLARYSSSGTIFSYDWSGGLQSASGSAYFKGQILPPYQPAGQFYRELHTFVRGNDNLIYGRYGTIEANGSVTVSPNWYAFTNIGQTVGKPDAVTWFGNPTTTP